MLNGVFVFSGFSAVFNFKGNPAGDLHKTVAPLYLHNFLDKLEFIREALRI